MKRTFDKKESPIKKGNSRYIAVVHKWFVSSCGFEVFELEANDKKAARDEADALAFRCERTHQHAAVKVIEIECDERIVVQPDEGDGCLPAIVMILFFYSIACLVGYLVGISVK